MNLKGTTALVTGAARRVGRVIALSLAQSGCNIVIHYRRSREEAARIMDEVKSLGVGARLFEADLSDANKTLEAIRRSEEMLSDVSVLINSASVYYPKNIEEIVPEDFSLSYATHVEGAFWLSRHIGLNLVKTQKPGSIVNITDRSAKKPYLRYLSYSASKAALENMTRSLALELSPWVRVNSVSPGAVLWPEDFTDSEKAKVISAIPLGRAGKPEDVANACVFLCESDYMNATTLAVDGGRSLL